MAGSVLLSAIFPDVIFRVNTSEKNLYFTFDDGPAEVTPWVLEELKKFNAQATFFCVGANIEKNIPLYNAIINKKHAVGNHTMNHLNGWKTKTKNYLDDVEKCNSVLKSQQPQTLPTKAQAMQQRQAGSNLKPQTFFRPPYGRITLPQYFAIRKNHRIVMWNVLSRDYDKNISAEKCLQRVIQNPRSGS